MFLRLLDKWSYRQERRALSDFIEKLAGMDGSEIGFVVAIAMDWRNELLKDGIDMLHPSLVLVQNPNAKITIVRTIQQLQQKGGVVGASGLMIWLHTLRAISRLELRKLGRNMWKELSRGFPHVERGAESAWRTLGRALNIDGAGTFPDGLTPEPKA